MISSHVEPKSNRPRLGALALAGGGLACATAILYFFDPAQNAFYPTCLFHAVTGLYCAGCGTTRAAHELLHGHIAAAARMNLLFVLFLPYFGYAGGRSVSHWLRGERAAFRPLPPSLWVLLVVSAAFTVLRNLPGLEWLAP